MLGFNEKTWRWSVAELTRRGMITVEHIPGNANVYEVVGDTEKWDTTPSKKREYRKTAPHPKTGTTPMPKNGRGTHTYNKELLKNNTTSTTRTHAHERLMDELLTDGRIELAMMQHRISEQQYRQYVTEILADWQFRGLADEEYNLNHFSSVLRYKVNDLNNRNNGNNQQAGSAIDIRTKLDQDAIRAMAALAEESRHPVTPTW